MRRLFGSPVLCLVMVLLAMVAGFFIVGPLLQSFVQRTPGPRIDRGEATPVGAAVPTATGPPAASSPAIRSPSPTTVALIAPAASPSPPAEASQSLTLSPSPPPAPTETPTCSATATPAPTSTPSPTPSLTPSPEPSRTPRPSPTASATQTPAPTARPTRSPSRSPVATGRPKATQAPPTPPLPPVVLGYPRPGMAFKEGDVIDLQWKPVAGLPEDAYYVPTVRFFHYGEKWSDDTPWLRDTTWRLSDHAYLPRLSDDGVFEWSVRVMRKTGLDPATGKPVGIPLNPASEVWTFRWMAPR